jgi:hypothetical protein
MGYAADGHSYALRRRRTPNSVASKMPEGGPPPDADCPNRTLPRRLLQMKYDRAFRYPRLDHARATSIVRDPALCLLKAFINASLIFAYSH